MKRRSLFLLTLILILASALLLSACKKEPEPTPGTEPDPNPDPQPTGYSVTFDADGQTESVTVESGKTVTEPAAPEKSGYSFLGWYDANGVKFAFTTPITADITLHAEWQISEYTATFKSDGAVVGEVAFTVLTDSITAPAIPEKPGYTGAWDSYTLGEADITVNAVYTPIEYTVTYHNNADGVTNGNPTKYTVESESFTIAPLSMENYVFIGWFGDAELTVPAELEIKKGSTGNIELYAKWSLTEYTATFVADGKSVGAVNLPFLPLPLPHPQFPKSPDTKDTGNLTRWARLTLR